MDRRVFLSLSLGVFAKGEEKKIEEKISGSGVRWVYRFFRDDGSLEMWAVWIEGEKFIRYNLVLKSGRVLKGVFNDSVEENLDMLERDLKRGVCTKQVVLPGEYYHIVIDKPSAIG